MDLDFVYDVLDLRDFFGQVFGFLSFTRVDDRASQGEGVVVCGEPNLLIFQSRIPRQPGLVANFDGAVELCCLGSSSFFTFKSGRVHMDVIDDGVAGRGLLRELFSTLLAIVCADDTVEGDDAGLPVFRDGYAAQVVLIERVVHGQLDLWMGTAHAAGGEQGCAEEYGECNELRRA